MGRPIRPGAARAVLFCALVVGPSAAEAGLPTPLENLSRHARVVLLGERHRTWGAPGLLLALVEGALSGEGTVAVGLEIPADRQPLLDRAAATGRVPDGLLPRVIDSPAYRAMFQGLAGAVRDFPARVDVLALDAPERSPVDRDGFMAERVLEAVRSGVERVVVLVGNLHVPTPPEDSLGGRLERLGIATARVLTLGRGTPRDTPLRWYPAAHKKTRTAVRMLWSLLARPPAPGREPPVHGLVVWDSPPDRLATLR